MLPISLLVLLTITGLSYSQQLPLVSYDDFRDDLGVWTAIGYVRSVLLPAGPAVAYTVSPSDTVMCGISRDYDDAQGWMLFRFDLGGEMGCDWMQAYSESMCPTSIYYADSNVNLSRSISIYGNFYRGNTQAPLYHRLPMVCAVHRFNESQGQIALGVPADGYRSTHWISNLTAYRIHDDLTLNPASYIDQAEIAKADDYNPELVDTVRYRYQITYSGIPVRASTLLVHLRPGRTTQMPLGVFVNDTFVANIATLYMNRYTQCTDCDEISFGWQPGTDTVSITFKGLRDSAAFTAEELTLFFVELDTTSNPTAGVSRAFSRTGAGALRDERSLFVDMRGRMIASAAASGIRLRRITAHTSGVRVEINLPK